MTGQSYVLSTQTPQHVQLLPAVILQFRQEQRWGTDVQARRDISRTVEDRG